MGGMGELRRKLLHISGGLTPLVATRLGIPFVIGATIVLAVAYVAHEIRGLRHLDPVKRHDRFDPAPLEYGFSVSVLLLLPNQTAAFAAIEILALGDGVASLVGRNGKTGLPGTKKTLEGTAACFVAGLAGALFFLDPATAVVVAAVGAIVEAYAPLDNLTVPFAAYASALIMASVF